LIDALHGWVEAHVTWSRPRGKLGVELARCRAGKRL
jgi:hypothetical protein